MCYKLSALYKLIQSSQQPHETGVIINNLLFTDEGNKTQRG